MPELRPFQKMQLHEFTDAQKQLQNQLLFNIIETIHEFRDKYGITPNYIGVDLIEQRKVGDRFSSFEPARVVTEFNLSGN